MIAKVIDGGIFNPDVFRTGLFRADAGAGAVVAGIDIAGAVVSGVLRAGVLRAAAFPARVLPDFSAATAVTSPAGAFANVVFFANPAGRRAAAGGIALSVIVLSEAREAVFEDAVFLAVAI
ncbi:MAG: hypothetical protein ACRYGL_19835 [Janthinobacterium lividum]